MPLQLPDMPALPFSKHSATLTWLFLPLPGRRETLGRFE
jgi:hypothetical protein